MDFTVSSNNQHVTGFLKSLPFSYEKPLIKFSTYEVTEAPGKFDGLSHLPCELIHAITKKLDARSAIQLKFSCKRISNALDQSLIDKIQNFEIKTFEDLQNRARQSNFGAPKRSSGVYFSAPEIAFSDGYANIIKQEGSDQANDLTSKFVYDLYCLACYSEVPPDSDKRGYFSLCYQIDNYENSPSESQYRREYCVEAINLHNRLAVKGYEYSGGYAHYYLGFAVHIGKSDLIEKSDRLQDITKLIEVYAQLLGKGNYVWSDNAILSDIYNSILGSEKKLFSLDTDKQWDDTIPRIISLIETELMNIDIGRNIDLNELHRLFKKSIKYFDKGKFDKFDKLIQEKQQKLKEEKKIQQKLKEEKEIQKKIKEEKKLEHDYDDTDWESLLWNS